MAGLWESWRDREGHPLESFTILVTAANAAVAPIHDRMPVILEAQDYGCWLDAGEQNHDHLRPLLQPASSELWELIPVSRRVNRPDQDDAGLIAPIPLTDEWI